jgi:hypothetical protein
LIRDAFGDLFELDSRLWRTLVPLMVRPGLLTKDYLEGRRARYMPPFRMYLVLSLVFFVVAFFDPREDLALFYEPVPPEVAAEQEAAEREEAAAETETDKSVAEEDTESAIAAEVGVTADSHEDLNLTINGQTIFGDCDKLETDLGDSPGWIKRRLSQERLKATCERVNAVGREGLANAIIDNIPAALILLLPIMALVLKFLYPLSRRFYVEHLLFFVHFHAFFFLILTLQILLVRIGDLLGMLEVVFTVIVVAASLYIPAYLFLSMRRVYGQGRILTTLKFIALSSTYLVGFVFVMLGALLTAVFSV